MSKNTSLAELMNYITIDTSSGNQLQMSGSIKQTSVTSSLLKANASGVLVAAVAGTDYQEAITGTGFVKSTGGVISYDTNTYATTASLSSYVPTSRTLTINGTAYDLSVDRSWTITSMIYPSAGIALSTGTAWGTSITNNSANWNTAYSWGNHASAGYLTGITSLQVTTALTYTPENPANKGVANGYASLDGSGLVPSTQLPSYVDDVLEYADYVSFPVTGAAGKIYVDLTTNKIYRWSGSAYIEVSPTVGTIWGGITGTLANQTDLQNALNAKQGTITLTTTGSSGASTFAGGTLNIPTYTLSGLGGQALSTNLTSLSGLTYASASFVKMTAAGTFSLDTNTYYLASNPSGYTTNTGTVTSVAALTLGTTGTDLSSSVATGTTTPVITLNVPTASATNRGVLSSTDWSTFNNKQAAITFTTTGSSGAATFSSNALNIPNYTLAGLGGQASSTNLTSLSGLSYVSASFVKMTAAGTFSLDTNTYYLASNPSGYITSSGSITGSAGSVAWTNVTGRPTAVSAFTNDSGYITSSGSISGNAATATTATNWGTYGGVPAAGQSFGTANTIGRSDVNGYTYFNYINSNTGNAENPAVSQVITTNGTDNFYRKSSIASFTTYVQSNATGSWGISVTGSAGSVAWTNVSGRPTAVSSFTNDSGYITSSASISGSSASAPLLSALNIYVWSASTNPSGFSMGIQSSFVSAAQGFQSYGSVMTMKTYSGGGGSLQLYVPYSPTYGGSALQVRYGNYDVSSGDSWTSWKTLIDSSNIASQSVNYATTAGTANSVAWTNVSGRPTAVSSFTNDSGYITSSGSISGNAATASSAVTLSTTRSNWSSNGTISAVVGQLSWKNYGNGHTIFDASAGTSPDGGAVNNTNSTYAWTGSYPTLMGWNGASTYGVRVDTSRYAESAGSASSVAWTNVSGRPTAVSSFTNDSGYLTSSTGVTTTYNSSLNSDSRNSRGVTRLYRNDSDSDYSVQTTWSADVSGYWSLRGFNGDTLHAGCYVAYSGYSSSTGSVAWTNVSGRPTAVSSFTNDSGYITSGGRAYPRRSDGGDLNFYWSGQSGQPSWLWGGNDGANMYVYNPSNFSVNYATSAGSASTSSQVTVNYNNDSNSTYQMLWGSGNSIYGTAGIYCNPATDTLYTTYLVENSSIRFKYDVEGLENSLSKVLNMRGVSYKRIGTDVEEIGVIAEEVEKIIPEVVKYENGEVEGVNYSRLTAVLIEAVKEQQKQIDELKNLLNNK